MVKKLSIMQTTDTGNLVQKTGYNTKINELEQKITDHDHDKYITIQELNKLKSEYFAARLAQPNLASKKDIAALVKKTDFDDKLKNLNKKATSNKTIHVEAEKKITDLTNKVAQISEIGYVFLFGRVSFIGNDGYQNFVVFSPMLSSLLILDTNKKVTNWILTGISSGKAKPFDTNLEPTKSNLANGKW